MKIILSQYEPVLSEYFRKRGSKNPEHSAENLIAYIESFLPCSDCGDVKPKHDYHKCSTFSARDGRYTICKACVKASRSKTADNDGPRKSRGGD